MRLLTVLLLAISIVVLAFDSVVQVYTKLYIDIQLVSEKKTEVYENGKLVKSETEKVYTTQASYEIWVLGSGFVIFSGVHKNEEKTLVMTNYHVIEFLTDNITELKKTYTTHGKVIGIVRGSFVNMFGATYPGQHLGISIDNVRDWLFLNGYGFVLKNNE